MSVIKHDFGKKNRLIVRRFRRLLRLDAMHEANVRANPLPYLERASHRIDQLEGILFEAATALKPASGETPSAETIEVPKAEYERLSRCRTIIETGLKKVGPPGELL
jgi:hypothetical protein